MDVVAPRDLERSVGPAGSEPLELFNSMDFGIFPSVSDFGLHANELS